jgi:hypothetical protein
MAYDQYGLAEEVIGQHAEASGPSVIADDGVHFGRALGQRQHHEHGVLGDRGRVRGTRDHQRHPPLAQRRHIHRVEADADARHHLHLAGSLELRFAEARTAKRHAMNGRVLAQLGLEINGRNHVGKFDHLDVVTFAEKYAAGLRERLRDENLLLVGCHFLPWVMLCAVIERRRSPRLANACC